MTIEEIRELIAVVNQSGIAELEVQRGENRVKIKRTQREVRVAVPQAFEAHPAGAAHAPIMAVRSPNGKHERIGADLSVFQHSTPENRPG